MLILTRSEGESVRVVLPDSSEIAVHVARIRGDRVRIGFDAPQRIQILRSEISAGGPPPASDIRTDQP